MFAGKNILITGGSSGIGKQLAMDFLRLGANVTIVANCQDKLNQAFAELSQTSSRLRKAVCDISDADQIRRTIAEYVELCGAPDILINNAGYAVYRAFEEMTSEEIANLLAVNLTGACLVTRECLPAMIAAGRGNIVMMASIAGRIPLTPCGMYSAAKHGLVTFAETLRAELSRFHIRVHVLCPGRVETAFFAHETFVQRAPRQEMRWVIPVEDVSAAVCRAIRRNRFLTYVPSTFGPMVWLAHTMPLLFRPMLQKLMRARIESLYATKSRGPEKLQRGI